MHTKIKVLETEAEWLAAFPVMKQLRSHLDETTYLQLVREATETSAYQLIALFEEELIVAVCGFMPMITLYNGKFIWICDLITDAKRRSKGYGKQLMDYVEQWAAAQHYQIISLSSGLQRTDAHRFYSEKMNFAKVSYVFSKEID